VQADAIIIKLYFLRPSLPRQVCSNKKRALAKSLNYLRIASAKLEVFLGITLALKWCIP
jgi:hypothetical protein